MPGMGGHVRRNTQSQSERDMDRVFRSISEPIRKIPTYEEMWKGRDKGLITCWEVGRKLRELSPVLKEKVENNELPVLGWKGGVGKELKRKEKFGTLNYLAQWQGIRGEDLDVSLVEEITLQCAKTGMLVTFTADESKYSEP